MALIHIWGDESSQNGHRFMVLGTIWQHPICAADLQRDIEALRRTTRFYKEFHWTEIKGHQLNAYKGLVEIFKEYMQQGLIKYRCIVVDQSDRQHKIYSDDDELHFYKMYFWLIYKRLLPEHEYDIFLDRKSNSLPGRLTDLKNALNRKMLQDHRNFFGNLVRMVEARDGSQIELQLADVFTGAIAYVRNGFYSSSFQNNPNNVKCKLVDHIQSILDVYLSECHYPTSSPGFNIWCFNRRK